MQHGNTPDGAMTSMEKAQAGDPSWVTRSTPRVYFKGNVLKLGMDGTKLPRLVVVTDTHIFIGLRCGGVTRTVAVRSIERVVLCRRGNDVDGKRTEEPADRDDGCSSGWSHSENSVRSNRRAGGAAYAYETAASKDAPSQPQGSVLVAPFSCERRSPTPPSPVSVCGDVSAGKGCTTTSIQSNEPAASLQLPSIFTRPSSTATPAASPSITDGHCVSQLAAETNNWAAMVTLDIVDELALVVQFSHTVDGDDFVAALRKTSDMSGRAVFTFSQENIWPTGAVRVPSASLPLREQDPLVPRVREHETVRGGDRELPTLPRRSTTPPVPTEDGEAGGVSHAPPHPTNDAISDKNARPPLGTTSSRDGLDSASDPRQDTPEQKKDTEGLTPSPLRAVPNRGAPIPPPPPSPPVARASDTSLPVPPPLEPLHIPSANADRAGSPNVGPTRAAKQESLGRDDGGAGSSSKNRARRESVPSPSLDRLNSLNMTTTITSPAEEGASLPQSDQARHPKDGQGGGSAIAAATQAAPTTALENASGDQSTACDEAGVFCHRKASPLPVDGNAEHVPPEVSTRSAMMARLQHALRDQESLVLELADAKAEVGRLILALAEQGSESAKWKAACTRAEQHVSSLQRQHEHALEEQRARLRRAHGDELEAVQLAFDEYDQRVTTFVERLRAAHREEVARWQHERRTLLHRLAEGGRHSEDDTADPPAVPQRGQGAPTPAQRVAAKAQLEAQRRLTNFNVAPSHSRNIPDPYRDAWQTEEESQSYRSRRRGSPGPSKGSRTPTPARRVTRKSSTASPSQQCAQSSHRALCTPPRSWGDPHINTCELLDPDASTTSREEVHHCEPAPLAREVGAAAHPPPQHFDVNAQAASVSPVMESKRTAGYSPFRRTYF